MASRIPCRYFQQGRCNRGNNCKFAHVYANDNNEKAQGNTSSMSETELLKSFINPSSLPKIERTIKNDIKDAESFQSSPLTSAYSYGAPCAVNLISGRDYSPEESRFEYYQARCQNTLPQYEIQINARESDFKECMNFTKVHTDWAARYLQVNTKQLVESGERSMRNEFISFPLDLTGTRNTKNTCGPFAGAFKQPAFSSSGLGHLPFGNSFGTPSFGSSQFGSGLSSYSPFSTSTLDNIAEGNNQPTFGKPNFRSSTFGSTAFGANLQQPSASGSSVFGKPSFGSSAPVGVNSVFGQPSFGSQAKSGSVFGMSPFKIDNNGGNSGTFGVLSNQTSSNPFDTAGAQSSAFGQCSFKSSPMGDVNTITQDSSPFGTSAFKQNKYPTASSPFGSAASNSSPFAFFKHNQDQPSPFTQSTSQTSNSPFGYAPQLSTKSFDFSPKPKSTLFSNISDLSIPRPITANFIQGLPTEEDKLSINDLDQETLQAFKNKNFNLGEVPDTPPPLELSL